jgi:protein-arginine kinase
MSLLTRYLDDALRDKLSRRTTAGGVRLEDVIRSGTLHPDSAIGVYAPDAQSYQVFGELFEPMLEDFRSPVRLPGGGLGCVNPAAVVSTRIRVARNLAGHAFAAGMTRQERLSVEAKIVRACGALGGRHRGWVRRIGDMPRHPAMVAGRLAFGQDDKYMAAAAMYADWPVGRSVFNTRNRQLSVWINEEDHLRVAVALPGACIAACSEAVAQVMQALAEQLDFCEDARLGYLTSCPSNVGSAMRASYMVDTRADALQQARLQELAVAGVVQVRGASGEHSGCEGGLADVGFRNRYGISEGDMLQGMEGLLATSPPSAR